MDAKQADTVLTRMKSGPLKAVIARSANVAGGITVLSPTVAYTADPLSQSYGSLSAGHISSSTTLRETSNEMSIGALEDYMFALGNQDRRENGGLPPLARSSTLGALARKYADDMKARNFFSHYDPEGLDPKGRAIKAGITASVWENLAMESGIHGFKGLVQRGEQQMMDEPRNVETNHRGCILSQRHHCVGIGVAVTPSKVFCVQEFSPSDLP